MKPIFNILLFLFGVLIIVSIFAINNQNNQIEQLNKTNKINDSLIHVNKNLIQVNKGLVFDLNQCNITNDLITAKKNKRMTFEKFKTKIMKLINVKDALPELKKIDNWAKSKPCLVLIKNDEYLIAEYNKGDDWEQWYCKAYDDIIENVTYWMSLPKPPDEE